MVALIAAILLHASGVGYSQENAEEPFIGFNSKSILNPNSWSYKGDAGLLVDEYRDNVCIYLDGPGSLSRQLSLPARRGVSFVTFRLQALAGEGLKNGAVLNIAGAKIGFREYFNETAPYDNGIRRTEVLAFDASAPKGEKWNPTGIFVSYSTSLPDLMSGAPVLTVRLDRKGPRKSWDLFVGSRRVSSNMGLTSGNRSRLVIRLADGEASMLRGFLEFAENPLFEDRDGDGVEDVQDEGRRAEG